ncbi:S16 family serine protease [Prosthecobacter sp.]|uniref:S16 family serine protease n=1 Tax=Prosthecobacter sp. TaxID=1965333 RepID=UPI0037841B12
MKLKLLLTSSVCATLAVAQTVPIVIPGADLQAKNDTITLPAQGRAATVHALWYRPKTFEGGTSPVTITVAPNVSGQVSVGIMESYSGGTGDDWRAAAWIASFCASQMTDHIVSDHTFLIQTGGHIGGPSAGMLMTTAMVALIRGDAILPDATLTGTINPDGCIGPVGGITHKLDGAKEKGMKRFGFPVGQRLSKNEKTGELDDLHEKAETLGMQAVEVKDIYDAYLLMTGKPLPRPAAIESGKMSLSVRLALRLRGTVDRRLGIAQQRVDALDRKFLGVAKAMVPSEGRMTQAALREAEEKSKKYLTEQRQVLVPALTALKLASKFEQEGDLVMALYYAQMADSQTRVDEVLYEMAVHLQKADIDNYKFSMKDQATATDSSLTSMRPLLKSGLSRATVGGRIDALQSFLSYWGARAVRMTSDITLVELEEAQKELGALIKRHGQLEAELRGKKSLSDAENIALVASAVKVNEATEECISLAKNRCRQLAMAQSISECSADWASFAQDDGPPVVATSQEFYERLGSAYSSAAGAGLKWFKAMFAEDYVKAVTEELNSRSSSAVSADKVQRRLLLREPEWGPVDRAALYSEYSSNLREKEAMLPLDQLASGLYAYLGCASLINKQYNFSGEAVQGVSLWLSNRKALSHTLNYARERVLEECGRLDREIGYIPDSIKVNYELANALRDGTDSERLAALKAYWKCNFLCDMARRFVNPTKNKTQN